MDKNIWMAILATAIIVGVLSSIITVQLTGNAVVPTTKESVDVYTKAEIDKMLKNQGKVNSCDGDGICETKSILINNSISENTFKIEMFNDNIRVVKFNKNLLANQSGTVLFDNIFTRNISISQLEIGLEKSFVCANKAGKLYASKIACV